MTRTLLAPFHFFLLTATISAQQPEARFIPPQAHDLSRYERTLGTNPFTLETAPVPAAVSDFAKDMTIGACFGDRDDPTVVLVNMKTHERHRLKKGEMSPAGFSVQNILLSTKRSECQVEIRNAGGQVAHVKFDEPYLLQLAGQTQPRPSPTAVPQQSRHPASRPPAPQSSAPVTTAARNTSAGAQGLAPFVPEIPPGLRGILPSAAFAAGEEQQPVTTPSEPGSSSHEASASAPQPVSTPIRKRVISAIQTF